MNKKRLARRMMTAMEKKTKGLPWYKTEGWEKRKLHRKLKVLRRERSEQMKALGL